MLISKQKSKLLGLLGLFAIAAWAGCQPDPDEGAAEPAAITVLPTSDAPAEALTAYPNATFFIVTHPDLRRCAWPLCGGFFTQRVNNSTTICADGTSGSECRILEFDYSRLMLDTASRDKLAAYVEKGQALLRGRIVKTAPILGATYNKLVAEQAFIARALVTPSGRFARVQELPLDCAGCATNLYSLLNSSVTPQRFHKVIFDPTHFSTTLAAELQTALSTQAEGILTAGVRTRSGTTEFLTVSEAYTPFPDYKPRLGKEGDACGTPTSYAACEDRIFCLRSPVGSCGRTDVPGVCTVKPEVCPLIFRPVCGCDGKTYGNACAAWYAGASIDYEGACKTSP